MVFETAFQTITAAVKNYYSIFLKGVASLKHLEVFIMKKKS
jgi:hypothetical protein